MARARSPTSRVRRRPTRKRCIGCSGLSPTTAFSPSPSRGGFALTPLSQPLRSDHPQSVRNTVRQALGEWNQRTWSRFDEAVRTGEPQLSKVYGHDLWTYFEDHPDHGAWFHGSMVELTRMTAPLLAAVYDFAQHRTLVDLGGGQGAMLSIILSMFPSLRGVVYDLEQAVAEAPSVLEDAGVADRCDVVAGNIFDAVPGDHDAYLLKHILHGLDAAGMERLFGNLQESLKPGTTLLIVEMLVPEDGKGTYPSYLDLQMLVSAGGRERTETEYHELLADNGFRLQEVHRTPSPVSLLVSTRS